jgi:hypothetical protein
MRLRFQAFANVSVINIFDAPTIPALGGSLPREIDLRGYQIKAVAMLLSSFAQILWLDVDNFPLEDKSTLFTSTTFQQHGVVLWPDHCYFLSVGFRAFGVFGLAVPARYPVFEGPRISDDTCSSTLQEVEAGQILWDKEGAWPALALSAYVSLHHDFFLRHLFHGDKMVFSICLLATSTTWAAVLPPITLVGMNSQHTGRGQSHPDSRRLFFMHLSLTKFECGCICVSIHTSMDLAVDGHHARPQNTDLARKRRRLHPHHRCSVQSAVPCNTLAGEVGSVKTPI